MSILSNVNNSVDQMIRLDYYSVKLVFLWSGFNLSDG